MITVGVIGYGYWGPNLVRNFAEVPGGRVGFVTDMRDARLSQVRTRYPAARTSSELRPSGRSGWRSPAIRRSRTAATATCPS